MLRRLRRGQRLDGKGRLTVGLRPIRWPRMKHVPLLGELETAVLHHVWSSGDVDVKEVHGVIGRKRRITLNTVQSTLERLFRKDLLARERVSHAYRYRAKISREEFRALAMASVAGDLAGAEAAGVLAAFVDVVATADRSNLERLAELVARARVERGGR